MLEQQLMGPRGHRKCPYQRVQFKENSKLSVRSPRTNFKKQTVRNNELPEQRGSKLEFVTSRVNVLLQINAFVTFDFEMFSVPRFRHYHPRLATISLLCNSGYGQFDLAYQKQILKLDFFFYQNILIRMKREPVHRPSEKWLVSFLVRLEEHTYNSINVFFSCFPSCRSLINRRRVTCG